MVKCAAAGKWRTHLPDRRARDCVMSARLRKPAARRLTPAVGGPAEALPEWACAPDWPSRRGIYMGAAQQMHAGRMDNLLNDLPGDLVSRSRFTWRSDTAVV